MTALRAKLGVYLPTRKTITKFLRFLAAGLPGLAIAVLLNFLLVNGLGLHKALAYVLVLGVQISVNFVTCLLFVFDRDRSKSVLSQYIRFVAVVGAARSIEWILYVALTSYLSVHYLFVQVFNAMILGIGKFVFTRRAIEKPASVQEDSADSFIVLEEQASKDDERPQLRNKDVTCGIGSQISDAWKSHLVVPLAYSVLTFVMVYLPLSVNLARTYIGHGEVVFWSNYFWWFDYALGHGLNPLVHSHIFHPMGVIMIDGVLPFLMFAPITHLLGSVVSYNLFVLFSFAASGYGMYLLARYLLKRPEAAFLAGVIFAFFPFHFGAAMGHLHTFSIMWIPFAVLFLFRLYEKPSLRNVVGLSIFVAANALTSSTIAVMLGLFFMLYALIRIRRTFSRKLLGKLVMSIGLACVIAAPSLYPTAREAITNPYMIKSIHNFVYYSADIVAFGVPSPLHPLFGGKTSVVYNSFTSNYSENIVFVGYVVALLGFIGAAAWWKEKHGKATLIAAAFFFLLSLGPVLHVMGVWRFTSLSLPVVLPGVLAAYVPVLDMIRVPSRYVIMMMFCVALLAARGHVHVIDKISARKSLGPWLLKVSTVIAVAIVLFEYSAVLPTQDVVKVPQAYTMIREDTRPGAILEIPICLLESPEPVGDPAQTMIRYYEYQKTHKRPVVSGYWSRSTPQYLEYLRQDNILSYLTTGYGDIVRPSTPSGEVVSYLAARHGVLYVLVHKALLSAEDFEAVVSFLGDAYSLDSSCSGDPLLVYSAPEVADTEGSAATPLSFFLGNGWHGIERWGGDPARWMSREADLAVVTEKAVTAELNLTARSFLRTRSLEILVGGVVQRRVAVESTPNALTVELLLGEGKNVITLRSDDGTDRPCDVRDLHSTDCRELSFGLQSISVEVRGKERS